MRRKEWLITSWLERHVARFPTCCQTPMQGSGSPKPQRYFVGAVNGGDSLSLLGVVETCIQGLGKEAWLT